MKMFGSEDAAAAEMPAVETPKGHQVAKPFNSPNRRFKAGDDITREDLAGSPLDFDHLTRRGFVIPT